jgi:hypothetical protein
MCDALGLIPAPKKKRKEKKGCNTLPQMTVESEAIPE